jgi:hypothetical protein
VSTYILRILREKVYWEKGEMEKRKGLGEGREKRKYTCSIFACLLMRLPNQVEITKCPFFCVPFGAGYHPSIHYCARRCIHQSTSF